MLANANKSVKSFNEQVHDLPEMFYLTGSKFFGNYTARSDTDYFAEYSEELLQKLICKYNFEVDTQETSYHDRNLAAVLYNNSDNVHIQLVYDVQKKLLIQELIKHYRLEDRNLPKQHRCGLWNFAYDLIDAVLTQKA